MADYQAQLDIFITNLDRLNTLQRNLQNAENTADSLTRRIGVLNGELQRTNTVLRVIGTDVPRGERGQFVSDPERRQRQETYREQRRIGNEQRQQRIELGRTRRSIVEIDAENRVRENANTLLERRIRLESRLNSATDLYQRKAQEFMRGGGGARLSDELQAQVATIRQTFDVVTAGGTRNLGLVRSLATELGRVVERQNEVNRLSTFQSKTFYQAQGFERRIAGLREQGAPVTAFGAVGAQMRELRSLSQQGNQFEAANVTRRLTENLNRIERELADAFRQAQIGQRARLARGSWEQFFADAADERLRLQAPMVRARQSWQRFFADAADEANRLRDVQIRESQRNAPSSPIQGGIGFPGSPIFNQTPFLERRFGRRGSAAISEGLIGGAFPLLFGQGVPAAALGGIGGVLGGLAGSGLGFGLSLIGTALGDAVTKLQDAAIDAAKSIRDPITNFEKLADAGLFASKAQELQIKNLIEYGNSARAASVIQEELAKKIGVLGLRDMSNLSEQSTRLTKAWAELSFQIQAAISGPLAGLLEWTANIVAAVAGQNRGAVQLRDFQASLPEEARREFNRRRALNVYGATGETTESLMRELGGQATPLKPPPTSVDPVKTQEELDKRRKQDRGDEDALLQRRRQTEDLIRSSREQIRQFDYQAIDLQRQAIDYNRKIKEDIFNREQQIQRDQISNDRLRKQIVIDTVDLQYRRQIANEDGRAAATLAAEADLMKLRKSNEADIEMAKRNLELDISKQKRNTENYIYGLAREADSIRRTTLKYELDVEDYKLKITREIEDIYTSINRQQEDMFARMQRGGMGAAPTGNLVPIGGGHQLDESAAEAFKRMQADAMKEGVRISLSSSYRSSAEQAVLYDRYLRGVGNLAAPPGRSMHEKGVAIDVRGGIEWMQRHGQRYGFANTGMSFSQKEPWHFEYMGGNQMVTPPAPILPPLNAQLEGVRESVRAINNRPQIGALPVSSVRSTMQALDAQDQKIKTDQIKLQEKLNQLQEGAALQRVLEAAQGENIIRQKQRELAFAIAEKDSVAAISAEAQEIAKFDARALETIGQAKEENQRINQRILENTKLTAEEKKKLQDATERYVANLKTTLDYERQILQIQQQQRFNSELMGLQLQLQTRGMGVSAGFFGGAAQRFEQEMLQSGKVDQATQLAQATRMLEINDQIVQMKENLAMLLDPTYQVVEGAKAMGGAFSEGFKGVISGSMSAQEALANFFQKTADHFLDMAAQIIAQQAVLKLISFGLGLIPGFGAAAKTDLGPAAANLAQYAPLPGRAMGGPVTGGMPYMVGERGPELFVPGSSGSIVPNHQLGGGDVSIMVNVDASGTSVQGDDQKGSELGRLVAVAVRQEMIKQKRPGGILAS